MANDLLGIIWGQSNAVGFADFSAAGGTFTGADGSDSLAYAAFAACTYAQQSSTAPAASGAQTYNINFGPTSLQPYAAAGGNNTGIANAVGRYLVKYNLCSAPFIGDMGIGSTSIPGHWAKASNFPTTGTTVYNQLVANINSWLTASGRSQVDFIIHQIGETDANTPARVTSAVSDITAMYAALATDVPATANAIIVMVMINPNANLVGDGDVAGYRAQQLAWAAGTSRNVVVVDPDNIPVPSDPHYRAGGYWDLGVRCVIGVGNKLFPGHNWNIGTGPAPWLQADGTLATTQNSTSNAVPRGEFSDVGERPVVDTQVLVATSYTANNTDHNLLTAAGFQRIGTLIDSTVATSHHQMSCWWRNVVDANRTTDAAGNKRLPSPAVQFPSSTLNLARIITVRGADPNNPIAGFFTGTMTATSATLKIPSTTTPMTVPANSSALVVAGHNGLTDTTTAISNTAFSGGAVAVARDSRANTGPSTVGMGHAVAPIIGTSLGQTTVTFSSTGTVGVGFVIVFAPDSTASNVTVLGDDTASGLGFQTLLGAGAVTDGDDAAVGAGSLGTVTVLGSGAVVNADDAASGVGQIAILGSGAPTNADDAATGAGSAAPATLAGAGSVTNADDAADGQGISGTAPVLVGSGAATLVGDTVIATGVRPNRPHLFAELAIDGVNPFTLIGPIEIYAGDSLDLVLTVTDDADDAFNLSQLDSIQLEVKHQLGAPDPALIAKSVGAGIEVRADITGRADITIAASETALTPGLYWIDVVGTTGGRVQHLIAPREFTVLAVVS